MYNMSFCLFYDGEEAGSYIELQQRQMWCFCLRSLLWQTHSFSAWLEKLFRHEKNVLVLTNRLIVKYTNETKWIPISLQVWLALVVAHCTVPVYIENEADCKRIPPSYCLLRLHWLQSESESQTNWDEGGDWSNLVPGLSDKALISPLVCLVCSGMRFYTLQHIAWLTQY